MLVMCGLVMTTQNTYHKGFNSVQPESSALLGKMKQRRPDLSVYKRLLRGAVLGLITQLALAVFVLRRPSESIKQIRLALAQRRGAK